VEEEKRKYGENNGRKARGNCEDRKLDKVSGQRRQKGKGYMGLKER
jgi:hypothetical protein